MSIVALLTLLTTLLIMAPSLVLNWMIYDYSIYIHAIVGSLALASGLFFQLEIQQR